MANKDWTIARKAFWAIATLAIIACAVCNTVFPIQNGQGAYSVMNLIVCAIAGVTGYKNIKELFFTK
jgi:hypothetical protein